MVWDHGLWNGGKLLTPPEVAKSRVLISVNRVPGSGIQMHRLGIAAGTGTVIVAESGGWPMQDAELRAAGVFVGNLSEIPALCARLVYSEADWKNASQAQLAWWHSLDLPNELSIKMGTDGGFTSSVKTS